MKYSRETLIEICERAILPKEKWADRDSSAAQENVGRAWALLKSGCRYLAEEDTNETILLTFWIQDFLWTESDVEEEYPYGFKSNDSCYLPTIKALDEADGEDWY